MGDEKWAVANEFIRMYWLQISAILIFAFCLWRLYSFRPIEGAVLPGVSALGGLICVIAPDEVSDWTGHYGWTTRQYRNYPVSFLSLLGVVVLCSTAIYLGIR